MDKDDVIETLNDLAQITEDSHQGYQEAAENAPDVDLKALFSDLASQRAAMVRDLQQFVTELGGSPETSGTIAGAAHRFFLNLKSLVTRQDREAIIREIERGESEAVRRYENALPQDLSPRVKELVRDH